jgi:5,10-methylenetetrahydromethanopterin reductase
MRCSLRLNNDLTLDAYVALARAAERHGFDQLWISNDLFLRSAPVLLTAVLQATERIEVGSGILNPHTIHPAELAMLAATLDELSGRRFNLGLGAGAADFLGWVGIDDARPAATMREAILAVRGWLMGAPVPAGRFVRQSEAAYLRFTPRRVTPIYLGAMGPAMLRLAGELADGALPLLFPPEHWHTVRPLIDEGRRRRAPVLRELDLAACIWVSLADDDAAARRALAEKIAYYGHALGPLIYARLGVAREDFAPIERALTVERDLDRACAMVDERMLRIGVTGSPAALVERLRPLVAAGVRHLSFGPPLGPDPLRAVELLGREVVPALRAGLDAGARPGPTGS